MTKYYRIPIVAACLFLAVTVGVLNIVKVKAANQCFSSCATFYNYSASLCPGGSTLVNTWCYDGSGSDYGSFGVLCQKYTQSGPSCQDNPGVCFEYHNSVQVPCGVNPGGDPYPPGSICYNNSVASYCTPDFVCPKTGPYGPPPSQPYYAYSGKGGYISPTCGQ
jgi:hypothetical protein